MHQRYPISNKDMRYVLCTFVVVPKRWIDQYGWRRFSEHEKRATAAYYRQLGRMLGITEIPDSFEEFERCLDAYEAEHFGWDEGARRVSDATLDLMASWYPARLRPLIRGASMALLDEPLRRAFRYPQPTAATQAAVRGALRLRARVVRALPPRRAPHYARQNPEIRSYRYGFRLAGIGTFPPGAGACPVIHHERSSSTD